MAQRCLSGLSCVYPSNNAGRWYTRVLVEWLTQVVGWVLVDKSSAGTSNWDNVAASGSTCSSTTARRVEVTSPGYAFSIADVGGYLTLTGFGNPYEARDGIYRIQQYIGAAGNVYTLELDIDRGVHSDGLPIGHSGLAWRFWLGTDAYCPSTTSDWAVIAGTGTTGAGLTNGAGTGDSIAFGGGVCTLTCAAVTFPAGDVAKQITIAGSGAGNDGTFDVTAASGNTISWANAGGSTEAPFTGTWTIRYTWHLHIKAQSWSTSYPVFRLAPWASWDAAAHAWTVGDLRYTAEIKPRTDGQVMDNIAEIAIFAEADTDHFTAPLRCLTGNYRQWCLYSAGELEAFWPDLDPRPCVVWAGGEYQTMGDAYAQGHIGFGSQYYGNYTDGLRSLACDDLTTVTSYAMFPHIPPTDTAWPYNSFSSFISGNKRKVSTHSAQCYRIPIICECRTANFMELRGTIRWVWACSPALALLSPQGASGEYVPVMRGMMIPWNGSRNVIPDVGSFLGIG